MLAVRGEFIAGSGANVQAARAASERARDDRARRDAGRRPGEDLPPGRVVRARQHGGRHRPRSRRHDLRALRDAVGTNLRGGHSRRRGRAAARRHLRRRGLRWRAGLQQRRRERRALRSVVAQAQHRPRRARHPLAAGLFGRRSRTRQLLHRLQGRRARPVARGDRGGRRPARGPRARPSSGDGAPEADRRRDAASAEEPVRRGAVDRRTDVAWRRQPPRNS